MKLGVLDSIEGNVLTIAILNGGTVHGVASVAAVNESFKTSALARVRLHDLLMLLKSSNHLVVADVVQEDAVTHRVDGNSSAKLAIASLEDSSGGLLKKRSIKLGMVHGETSSGEEVQETSMFL
jgi:hypothetical protein